jgi:hypothetical protein
MASFPFVQMEFTHALGPPPGRYVLRDTDAPLTANEPEADVAGTADILLVQLRAAEATRTRRRRRDAAPAVSADEGAPEVSVIVATVVLSTQPLASSDEARGLMAALETSEEERESLTKVAIARVNQAIAAFRVASADPYIVEITRADPRAIRVGHGPADLLYSGRWEAAVTVPQTKSGRVPRSAQNMPTQAMSMILGGLAKSLEGEELVLRAVLDLEQGRWRGAAVGLWSAVGLLLSELDGEELPARVHRGLDHLVEVRDEMRQLAAAANERPLVLAEAQRLGELCETVGAFVDLRRYDPLGF